MTWLGIGLLLAGVALLTAEAHLPAGGALGVLGMIALSGKAVSATAESQYRADASNFANAIASVAAHDRSRPDRPFVPYINVDATLYLTRAPLGAR